MAKSRLRPKQACDAVLLKNEEPILVMASEAEALVETRGTFIQLIDFELDEARPPR